MPICSIWSLYATDLFTIATTNGVFPQTSIYQQILPMAGFQHVAVDADVRPEEPFQIETRFAGGLNADEQDSFH
jgi:hypothetical protein